MASKHVGLASCPNSRRNSDSLAEIKVRSARGMHRNRLTLISALLGNDISTLPDFPAEIGAPAGTLAGASVAWVALTGG